MNKSLSAALTKAIDFEVKGRSIYEEASSQTKNPIVKRTFQYLASQEAFHIEELERYKDKQKIELEGDQPHDTQGFFLMTLKEFKGMTRLSEDDIQAHETALKLEKNSYEFYSKEMGESTDPALRQFFEFLMKQEKAHFVLVQKTLEFIKDPVRFYQMDEDAIFEGG